VDNPCIIMCAPNGARRGKADHPELPITPLELADCSAEILHAGACIIHLHVRDRSGGHTLDVDCYRRAIDAIRDRVGRELIIQVTSESVGLYTPQQQMDMVRQLQPEAVSLALREICSPDTPLEEIADFFDWMQSVGIFPQVILHNADDLLRYFELSRRDVFASQSLFMLHVLSGSHQSIPARLREIQLSEVRPSVASGVWAACCFGPGEFEMVGSVAAMGGHVRVGFENNLWHPDGRLAVDNAELVTAARERVTGAGRAVANADYVRQQFSFGASSE
jgi:3-keto-5-aminohexanoate cleavage enzyme